MITILTSSENKYLDLRQSLYPFEVTWQRADLEEIQSLDPIKIIEHKLREAQKFLPGQEILIDDRSLSIECLSGLPGTLVKWFLEAMGPEGIYRLTEKYENKRAVALCNLGYISPGGEFSYFSGETMGNIVSPRGDKDYGWGPIFQPLGQTKTYGEMEREEKNLFSHHAKAIEKFKNIILNKLTNHKTSALAIILDSENRIIAQKRDDKPEIPEPGQIGLFGGGGELGEDPFKNIKRELLEELELDVDKTNIVFYKQFHPQKPIHKNSANSSSIFVITNVDSDKLVLHEGQEIMKIPPDKLREFNWCPECLDLVLDYLAQN